MNLDQLMKLYDIEKKSEQFALIQLNEAQTNLNYFKSQLRILQKYREDYIQEFEQKKKATSALSISSFHNHYHFDAKLEKGIDSIKQQMVNCEARVAKAKRDWAKVHSRVKALDFLVKKKQNQALFDDMVYEQFALDEFTTRLASVKNKK